MARYGKVKEFNDYRSFLDQVGHGQYDGVDVTHDGYPLSVKESRFISLFVANGNINRALREAGLRFRDIAGKDYITDEIKWRLDQLKKETIADGSEVMQYLTKVMRGQEKDQFGLDAPLAERTKAAQELAKRVVDIEPTNDGEPQEVRVILDWGGFGG